MEVGLRLSHKLFLGSAEPSMWSDPQEQKLQAEIDHQDDSDNQVWSLRGATAGEACYDQILASRQDSRSAHVNVQVNLFLS